ncbi:MAG: flagellar assembly protein FliW [Clostridiales bacterium]|nr:flagellar assembly protein FliW [Clostridiales bacterium]
MKIQTDYYGEVEYEESDLLTIPGGFLGFSNLKYYLPICISEDDGSVLLLQSTEQPEIAFVVINPAFLCADYSPVLPEEELSCLGVSEEGELSYYSLCVIRDNYLENTVNMKCPLAINPLTREGKQVILDNPDFEYRHKISSFPDIIASDNLQNGSRLHADTSKEKK